MKMQKKHVKQLSIFLVMALLLTGATALHPAYREVLAEASDKVDKRENVYVLMDADGGVDQVTVSEQLSNPDASEEIVDLSNLESIENASGDESFEQDGQTLIWKANGNRIDYRGKYTGELPVNLKIIYYLNGEQKSADEIAGAAGEVKIRLDYEILKKAEMNGESYVYPYTFISALSLDNEHFSDIKVSNGKVMDDGSQSIVFALALPSMNENLGLDPEVYELPSSVEISAKTDAFTLSSTYTVALPGLFGNFPEEETDRLESKYQELNLALSTLSTSSNLLLKAAERVSDGSLQLDEGMEKFAEGLEGLFSGCEGLEGGISSLQQGLSALSARNGELNAGVQQLEASVFASASQQLNQLLGQGGMSLNPENYAQVLEGVAAQLSAASEVPQGSAEKIAELKAQLDSLVALVSGIQDYTAGVSAAAAGSQQLEIAASALKDGAVKLQKGQEELSKGAEKLAAGSDKLKRSMDQFDQKGIQALTNALHDQGVEEFLRNMRNLYELSSEPELLGGKAESMTGEGKIIFKTSSISLGDKN